jgi:hypothetical protein
MREDFDLDRRRFLGMAAMAMAAHELFATDSAQAQPGPQNAVPSAFGRVPRDRSVSTRLRHDPLSIERDASKRSAISVGRRHHSVDGCARHQEVDRCRVRLGRADRKHRRRALARTVQGNGVRQRLSDRQPRGEQNAAATEGRARMVIPVLLRHRSRPRRIREIRSRICEADLADGVATVAIRRRDVRPEREGVR